MAVQKGHMMVRFLKNFPQVLILLVLIQGCLAKPSSIEPSSPTYTPVFIPGECDFPVPAGFFARCGYLAVPEDRTNPASNTIYLGVAVFPSSSSHPALDPVIHLIGGPGGSALANAQYILQKGGTEILKTRDYILFDQRGTLFSDPYLSCQSYDEYLWEARQQDISLDEYNDGALPFVQACLEEWRLQGIDISAYTSAESAADVNDLRLALGYDQVNLYGISYGSRLALTVMRDFPENIRSVIIDAVEPIQMDVFFTGLASNYWRSLKLVFQACANDESCSRYGNLEEKYLATIERLEESPVTMDIWGPYQELPYAIILDGDLLIDVFFGTLYSMNTIADIPYLVDAAYHEKYDTLSTAVGRAIGMPLSMGLYWTTECREEAPFVSPLEEFISSIGVPDILVGHFDPAYIKDTCAIWNVPPSDSVENRGVVSDIPTLVFAGNFDPITPPSGAELVASKLKNHYYFEFSTMSHGVMRSNPCALQMGLAFLDDPTVAPDSSCMTSEGRLEFH